MQKWSKNVKKRIFLWLILLKKTKKSVFFAPQIKIHS